MAFLRIPPPWQLPESAATPEANFWNRRRFIKTLVGAGIATSATGLAGCGVASGEDAEFRRTLGRPLNGVTPNPDFRDAGRAITEQRYASQYNNFYEFGGTKSIWQNAQKLPTDPWQLEVSGLVKNPRTYDLDDLTRRFPLEERVYRFRCVEAWAMVVPWIGFPMAALLAEVETTAAAKFARFTSYHNPEVTPGPAWEFALNLPWPYQEGLRIEEMANELAFFAVGIYGRTLPKQHGAPVRMVVPWKYGFKGAKSIVKIEFLAEQPATYWNTISPNEYKFEANVEPQVPHPRWSQSRERLVGTGSNPWAWEVQPTVIYNGYGEQVAHLYA